MINWSQDYIRANGRKEYSSQLSHRELIKINYCGNYMQTCIISLPQYPLQRTIWINAAREFTITSRIIVQINPHSKVHGANTGPTWVLSSPGGPHVGPINLAIRESKTELCAYSVRYTVPGSSHLTGCILHWEDNCVGYWLAATY